MNSNVLRSLARGAVAFGLAAAGAAASAAAIVGIEPGANRMDASVVGDLIEVDLQLLTLGSATFGVALEASDVGGWLRFNAVVANLMGADLAELRVAVSRAEFAWVGSVTPSFGVLASIDGDDHEQRMRFEPGEPFGIDLGAPFGQVGTEDWLIAAPGLQAGDVFTVTISAVPEPESVALILAGLGAVGWIARRRKQ